MTTEKRTYRKSRRADLEAQTARRITESAVELHGTLGPARTSISAVAKRAGVRRATVYRHFPDEDALFLACSSHWTMSNPPPDLDRWAAIDDPGERLSFALAELFGYYRRTERMMENILRDEASMPVVQRMLERYHAYISAARGALAAGRRLRGRTGQRVLAAIGHALTFATWHSLTRAQGLDDGEAAGLMCRLVEGASAPSTRQTRARLRTPR